ncbi:MAG: SH3-like domain-containing protein [Streptococcaceae bacterium]|nr:SH3-like domain-containing protein [Streptococcaceae bacterium]
MDFKQVRVKQIAETGVGNYSLIYNKNEKIGWIESKYLTN